LTPLEQWRQEVELKLRRLKLDMCRIVYGPSAPELPDDQAIRVTLHDQGGDFKRADVHDPVHDGISVCSSRRIYAWLCTRTGNVYAAQGATEPSGNLNDKWGGTHYCLFRGLVPPEDIPTEIRALWPEGVAAKLAGRSDPQDPTGPGSLS
jgi:hypothetical protein